MNCSEINEYLLSEYVKGTTLAKDETLRIEQHLLECSACQKDESELRSLFAEIATLPTGEEPQRDLWPAIAAWIAEQDEFLTPLAEALALRQVDIARTLIFKHFDTIVELDPLRKYAAAILGHFTQWMEMSGLANRELMPFPSYLDLVRTSLARFPRPPRPFLRLADCAHLHMIEGFVAIHAEEYDAAISHFSWVLSASVQHELGDRDLVAVASGAAARAHARKGTYEDALPYAENGIAIALESNRKELAAAISVVNAWIMFQLKKSAEAIAILLQAESVLLETDDYLTLANIKAALGRIFRRDGKYIEALAFYTKAVDLYKRCDSEAQHPNLARVLVNMALLERLIAQRIEKSSNQVSQGTNNENETENKERGPQGLREAAVEHLAQARIIYERVQDFRGRGSVLLVSALLHFDCGDLDGAGSELLEAYTLGKEKADHILMARARIQQSMVENARAEARSGDEAIPASHAESARSLAEDAVMLSEKTQNPRLKAHSYIWCGIALLDAYMLDSERARQCYEKADELLKPEPGRDLVWDDLQALKGKLVRAGHTDLLRPQAGNASRRALSATAS
jgi:tetratricopeptide (TPR) repeat protein